MIFDRSVNQVLAVLICTLFLVVSCGGGSGSTPPPPLDTDGDGMPNSTDLDDDNDGVPDTSDAFPLDANESVDTDGDGIGNNADTDDDGDGVADADDAFPLDGSESVDTDGDGTGDNADTDDDNDGVDDVNDPFPLDPTRTTAIVPLFPVVNGEFVLPTTQAALQLQWILDQLAAPSTSMGEITARFDPATLAVTPAATWQAFFDTLRALIANGTVQDIITMTPTNIRVLVGDASVPANGVFVTLTTTYATGLIKTFGASGFPLNGTSVGAADTNLTFDQAADKLLTLAESSSILVAQIDSNNLCVPIVERSATQSVATASIFKIWVMGALAQAIEDGTLTPSQTVVLTTDDFVLAGSLNSEPVGTQIPVIDYAILMLGISDNTATEHLFTLVGRPAIEAILSQFNFATLDVMLPFLSMNEAFHLFFTVPEADALAFVNDTETGQRDYVNDVLEPLGPVTNFSMSNPSILVNALWQASATDVCNAIAGLRMFNDTTVASNVINQAFGAETFGINVRGRWERVWHKGGSLSDGAGQRVFTLSWLLESDTRGAFVVVAMGNNDSGGAARIDPFAYGSVALRLVQIVDDTF